MQDPTLNRNDNGSLYREPFYFDFFYLRYMLNLRLYVKFNINLNLIFCELKESIAGREHCCGKKTQIDTFPENLRKIPVHFHKN